MIHINKYQSALLLVIMSISMLESAAQQPTMSDQRQQLLAQLKNQNQQNAIRTTTLTQLISGLPENSSNTAVLAARKVHTDVMRDITMQSHMLNPESPLDTELLEQITDQEIQDLIAITNSHTQALTAAITFCTAHKRTQTPQETPEARNARLFKAVQRFKEAFD